MRSSLISFVVFAAVAIGFADAIAQPADCPVTRGRDVGEVGNDALKTFPYPDGKITFRPGGAGFVDRDGSLGIKFAWFRHATGKLQVGGKRLDGEAAPARAYIYDYPEPGFQPIYLVFPTPGCWEITGVVGDAVDAPVTFIVLVEKIGDGPNWRFQGLESGWRVSSRSVGG